MKEREDFLIKLNEAFAKCDDKFISSHVTKDIKWVIIGEKVISGKEDFENSLERMKLGGPMNIKIVGMILKKKKAVVEGIVETRIETGKIAKYAFCDIYIFTDAEKNTVRELRTYVSQMKRNAI